MEIHWYAPIFDVSLAVLDMRQLAGNYDVSKMHYEGPGNIPGASGTGYGYEIRVEGRSSANPPEETDSGSEEEEES